MDNKKKITILIILSLIITILGGTLAYWNWQTSSAQDTSVTFTVESTFSCSADGGGPITSSDVELVPSTCDNANYAIKRMITVNPTLTGADSVNLSLWLNIVSMDAGLRNSDNFRYVLTKNSETCSSSVAQGTFKNKANGSTVPLLNNKEYTSSTPDIYYLYIWLDWPETSQSTQNQNFNFTLGGNCTNQVSTEQVYTVNLYDESKEDNNSVLLNSRIPYTITQYPTPEAAITALETAYSQANNGLTKSLPFFLKHTIGDFLEWHIIRNNDTTNYLGNFSTESDCNTALQKAPDDGNTYTCNLIPLSNAVIESYVGFVVTPDMVANNPGMVVARTYYLKGGDKGASFLDNAKTIYDAFGGVGCYLDDNEGGNPYTTTPSSNFYCEVSGLSVGADSYGNVGIYDDTESSYCNVAGDGSSYCEVNVDDGGSENS